MKQTTNPKITTTIPFEQWELARRNNWKWSEIFKAGMGALVQPSVQIERITALEAETKALKIKLTNMKRGTSW
jgi:hypothetical protein